MSWRPYKHLILSSLLTSGNDVQFTRRFMLYRHGVNIPKNVIHYYNSQYRNAAPEEVWKEISPVCQFIRRAGEHSGAES